MRILFYCKDYFPLETGFSLAFQGLCEALTQHHADVEIDVVTPIRLASASERIHDRVRIFRLDHIFDEDYSDYFGGKTSHEWKAFRALKKLVSVGAFLANRISWSRQICRLERSTPYDCIFFESGDEPLVFGLLPKRLQNKSIVRFHSTGDTESARFKRSLMAAIERLLIRWRIARNLRAILATSPYHLSFTKEFYYQNNPLVCSSKYFGVIDNAVPDFGDRPDSSRVRSDTRRLVALGRMDALGVAQKGFEDLLHGLATLDKQTRSRLDVEIIGDGALRLSLEALAKRLSLENITFCGRLSNNEVRARLLSGDVVVLLSRFEGRSMFAIEGLLAGCAAFFTKTGGLADLVQGNGWLVEVQDISAIGRCLSEISRCSIDDLQVMGDHSRELALANFSAKAVADSAYGHLRNLVEFLKA